jgi:hypothetical protein
MLKNTPLEEVRVTQRRLFAQDLAKPAKLINSPKQNHIRPYKKDKQRIHLCYSLHKKQIIEIKIISKGNTVLFLILSAYLYYGYSYFHFTLPELLTSKNFYYLTKSILS